MKIRNHGRGWLGVSGGAGRGGVRATVMGLLLTGAGASGCGQAQEPSSDEPSGGESDVLEASAPTCSGGDARFSAIRVWETTAGGTAGRAEGEFDGSVVGQGVGLPDEMAALGDGLGNSEGVGWLQVARAAASTDGGSPSDGGDHAGWIIAGPSEIGAIPDLLGERVSIEAEHSFTGVYNPWRFAVTVSLVGGRVVLLHQDSEIEPFGEQAGFSLTRGATVCQTRWLSCLDNYEHELEVRVPDGSSASLAPHETRQIGDYRVQHGATHSVAWLERPNPATGECSDIKENTSQVTALFLPDAE